MAADPESVRMVIFGDLPYISRAGRRLPAQRPTGLWSCGASTSHYCSTSSLNPAGWAYLWWTSSRVILPISMQSPNDGLIMVARRRWPHRPSRGGGGPA